MIIDAKSISVMYTSTFGVCMTIVPKIPTSSRENFNFNYTSSSCYVSYTKHDTIDLLEDHFLISSLGFV